MNLHKVLVCGGRDYEDYPTVKQTLDKLHAEQPIDFIIEGGAGGADTLAKRWSNESGVHCIEVRALWDYIGRSAGYKRNEAMLALEPSLVVVFPGGNGTKYMAEISEKEGIEVLRV